MTKDYAKYHYREPSRSIFSQGPFPYIFALLLLLLLIGLSYQFYSTNWLKFVNEQGSTQQALSHWRELFNHHEHPRIVHKTVEVADAPKTIHFDFYNELPTLRVPTPVTDNSETTAKPHPAIIIANPNTASASPSPAPSVSATDIDRLLVVNNPTVTNQATATRVYWLQLGVFKDVATASRLKAKIALLGQRVTVVTTHSGPMLFYRVLEGPYPSLAAVKTNQSYLTKQGIVSVIRVAST